jgi:serine phosphatase RsbU (regulator of sigma subunit)/ketosteroid isomerase-like protein
MYAYIRKSRRGFFGGVRAKGDRPLTLRDPLPPLDSRSDSERHPSFLALRVHEQSRSWTFEDASLCRLADNPSVNAADHVGWHYSHGIDPLEGNAGRLGEEEAPVSVEEKKALVRRFLDAQSAGDLETLDELLAPDFVDHNLLPGQDPGREGFMRGIAEDHAAISYIENTIDYQAIDGDMVITRLRTRTIHDRGLYLGVIPPTNQVRENMAILIHRVCGGKIVEEWSANSADQWVEDLAQEMRERERVEQELQVARNIQQASLPEEVPQLEGWQISPFYQPAREVGGDFYDFDLLSEGRLGVAVGDATGKGVPAALVMSTACGMLQAVARALGSSSPGEVLEQVNETLFARIPANMFVTCFYAILDPQSGSLSYANAGHDLPYVRRGGECEELRATGMPLGLMPGMSYEEGKITLEAGEGALFYSDGLVEAHDPKGEMFGFPRLRKLVAQHGEEGSLVNSLLEELYSFTGDGWEQEDDITLVTLRSSVARS